MTGVLSRIRARARAAAFSVVGILLGLVGMGFLTVALWIFIDSREGALVAFTVIGGIYAVLGFVFMMFGAHVSASGGDERASDPGAPTHEEPPQDPWVRVAEGFAIGLQAGRNARDPRR
ncbi:hypothetical protein SAMN04490248_13216 [Salinihabitans flavidus]|uniref:Holin-X, holin superfamily III n=1 Tax=Salinihabitans flavidus TaxID=569882 RepID=A0A1H8VQD2_9RHOB|nr:phage holin family protein [Salinihabitans flavidus]SEP17483.1 hypothetical protein SAMN04490248_13216 [Salinihabitans flavidus]